MQLLVQTDETCKGWIIATLFKDTRCIIAETVENMVFISTITWFNPGQHDTVDMQARVLLFCNRLSDIVIGLQKKYRQTFLFANNSDFTDLEKPQKCNKYNVYCIKNCNAAYFSNDIVCK